MEFIKKIGYDICVSEENLQSPLPPRRIDAPEVPEAPMVSAPVAETVDKTTISQQIQKQKENFFKKNLVFIIVGAAVLLIVLLVMALRSRMSLPNAGKVELNYWGIWEESGVMEGVIADFEAKNPNIKINYKKNNEENYKARLQNKLSNSNEESDTDIPDIFRIHQSWIPMFNNDLAMVPTETANKIGLETDFYETFKALKSGANYKAIPLMYDGLALFYNKSLIEAAGIGAPKTWNDLRIAAEKVVKKEEFGGKIITAGVALGSVNNVDHWSDVVGLMLKQGGVNPLKNSDDEKLKSVLLYYSLYRTQYGLWDETWPASTIAFANGNLGFYFAPSWRVFNLKDINANLSYEIVPVPQLEIETGQVTDINWSSYWVEGVNAKSKHQKEAFKFLEYLASVEGLQKMFTLGSQIRDFGQISPRKSMNSAMVSNPKIRPFVGAAETGENWYLSSRTFDGGLNDEMIKYFGDAINSIVNENKNANDVVPILRSGINQLKQRYSL